MSTRKDVSSRVASPPFELKGSKLSDAKKSADTLDTEAVLRQKLLKRQQEKTGARHTSDDEDVLRNQRETGARRHETSSKAEPLRRTREEVERHGSEARERERANRKPIRWEDSKEREERQRSHTDSKRHKAKDDRLSDRRTLSYRRESPLKRKLDDPRETRTERSSDLRQSDDRHHHRHRHEKHHRHERSSDRRTPEPPRRDGAPSSSSMRRSATTVGDLAPSGRDVRGLSAEARHEPELVSRGSEGSLRAKLLTSPIADKAPILPLPAANLSEVKATAVGISPSDLQPTSAGEEEPGEVADMAEPSTLHLSDVSTPSPLADFGTSPVELTSMETEEREEVAKEEEETSDTDDYRPVAYKKSRFESSPEMDDDGDVSFEDDLNSNDAMDVEDLDESIMNLSELERKGFDELTDEDKARLSPDTLERMEKAYQHRLIARLPVYYPGISGCRNVNEFECVNRIEEGTFGVVFRAVEKKTDETVALKRLKMENELNGFPITSLREINMLWKCGRHPNIVNLREIVVGSNMDKIYLVMDYIDHDVKALMETMSKKGKTFTMGQVKALMQQLLYGVQHLHQEYVIHRDLKTSNLLLTRNGILKIGDFGLAREYGDPLKPYTPIVVTLWYRSPELLLGVKEYSTAVDMWSVGCIFGEFLQFKPLFPGRGEIDQLNKIFTEIGTPNEKIWPGYSKLPGVVKFAFVDTPYNQLRRKFKDGKEFLTDEGFELLNRLLAPCPKRRHSASTALHSKWFREDPLPVDPSLFPTWPSKSDAFCKDKPQPSAAPKIPPGLSAAQLKLMEDLKVDAKHMKGDGGFSLKFDAAKF